MFNAFLCYFSIINIFYFILITGLLIAEIDSACCCKKTIIYKIQNTDNEEKDSDVKVFIFNLKNINNNRKNLILYFNLSFVS